MTASDNQSDPDERDTDTESGADTEHAADAEQPTDDTADKDADASEDLDLRAEAADIQERFSDHLDVTVDEVHERLTRLVSEYNVPASEATRSVTNNYLDEAELERSDIGDGGGDEHVDITTIESSGRWVGLTAKVVELWDSDSDSVAQTGLLGDETGTIKFTKWSKSELPTLEEGQVYELGSVVTDEYEGRYSVNLNQTTTIDTVDTDIEVGDDSVEIEGAFVDIQSGSGLIERCPEEDCTRVVENDRCSEHGSVDGEYDLRIKGVIDTGREVHKVIFNRERTEALTDTTLEEAIELAETEMDKEVVANQMEDIVLGRYYRISGPPYQGYVLADEVTEPDVPDHQEVLIKARSI